MSQRSEGFRLRARQVRQKIGTGDPRLNPVWENIAHSFERLADTADQYETVTILKLDYSIK